MYTLCIEACGSGAEPFGWPVFSQQFGAWLLPWLALISQLPFGARFGSENLMSALLTVGSPTLAAYSLALTALNERWVSQHFYSYNFPNIPQAVRILTNLQQTNVKVISTGGLLASLVVLPENDNWWATLAKSLNYTQTWSISAATSIAWVVIAYLFTIIDSFFDLLNSINANFMAVISPKCDMDRVEEAMEEANKIAYVASKPTYLAPSIMESTDTQTPPVTRPLFRHIPSSPPHPIPIPCTIMMASPHLRHQPSSPMMACRHSPLENLSQVPSGMMKNAVHLSTINEVSTAFHHASDKAKACKPVNRSADWKTGNGAKNPDNRTGNIQEVESYCSELDQRDASIPDPLPSLKLNQWGADTFPRMFVAALMALFLQWGTTGAAVVVVWFTPTKGLGCRSLAYLLYASISAVVWVIMVLASVLAHYADAHSHTRTSEASSDAEALLFEHASEHTVHNPLRPNAFSNTAATLSTILRRSGKLLATLNDVGIVAVCIFQFSNVFDRCYCNSSVNWLGTQRGYAVLDYSDPRILSGMKSASLGGIVASLGSAFGFIGFVNTFLNRPFI
ncbi:hypothetical protein FIBSPDRAFT_979392 [Athelia psychrophila]|uniref:Uncharacterized protein n=1 Tax=Athelia psychrophila TaxID=1759441 RepID=A0A166DM64_9AGAM|nr:hypothetical protein FIBSPDRAFT_979392 [Fibularhizoctonia sp. CBS 109695]